MKQELTGTRYNITSEATGLRFYVTGIIGFVITSKTKLRILVKNSLILFKLDKILIILPLTNYYLC